MTSLPEHLQARPQGFVGLFWAVVLCWLIVSFSHLYFFSYPSMDSWCYAAPACVAGTPFAITAPFLGSFEGANLAWGFHWPGGPLLVSAFVPFLPHSPLTFVLIYFSFWVCLSLATYAYVLRITSSWWLALAAFILIAADRNAFSITWLERYELLGDAIAIAAILAICGRQSRLQVPRLIIVGIAFYLFPLLHPVFSGLGGTYLAWLGIRSQFLKQSWKYFWIALAAYTAGWLCFIGYYQSRPWLYALFKHHAQVNLDLTHNSAPPGIHTFLLHLTQVDAPTRAGALIYVLAIIGVGYLLVELWKARQTWKLFLIQQDMLVFAALGLLCDLFLSQFTYNVYYWATAWPFAIAVFSAIALRIFNSYPAQRRVIAGAISLLLVLHTGYLVGRTYLWYKIGMPDERSRLDHFAQALPPSGQLFIPEGLWENFTRSQRVIYMNSVPYLIGEDGQKEYSAYVNPKVQSGDVLVIDKLQNHPSMINPQGPGWKVIGHCAVTYTGDKLRGFDMTAYQKQ